MHRQSRAPPALRAPAARAAAPRRPTLRPPSRVTRGATTLPRAFAVDPSLPPAADPDLLEVLLLCDDGELAAVDAILNGISLTSPLVKSLAATADPPASRAALVARIDSRFRFLAADAGATLVGRRPSYRETLLRLRDRLGLTSTPSTLATADLEADILASLLGDASTPTPSISPAVRAATAVVSGGRPGAPASAATDAAPTLVAAAAAAALSSARSTLLRPLASAAIGQAAAHDTALAALVSAGGCARRAAAVRGAAKGAAAAAARHGAARAALAALSAASWALLAADMGRRAVGTDWARLTRAVVALASVRLVRTHGVTRAPPVATPRAPPRPTTTTTTTARVVGPEAAAHA